MLSRSPRRAIFLPVLAGLAGMLATLFVTPTGAGAAEPDPTIMASEADAEAKAALSSVSEALAGNDAIEPTLALRDLALLRGSLRGEDRAAAEDYLARPTDGGNDPFHDGYTTTEATPACSAVICVHYVRTTADRPSLVDDDTNGIPDFVDLTLATLTHVHETYVGAGYRAPLPDGTRGGDSRVDIYLKDVGNQGLYGYCTTDKVIGANRDAWAYCVLDNDYATSQFPANTPRANLQVTAAHEYFHAVQFGYDIGEDGWFLEATATWAEDEVYDDVNDNRQYLASSPLTSPRASMDQFSGLFHYGTWIFFRFLSERLTASEGGMPTVVRDMWRRADDAVGGPDDYSLKAVRRVLNQRGLPLTEAFARFSQANRMPGRSYDEGAALKYPAAPVQKAHFLTRHHPTAERFRVELDHLTSTTVRYTPSAGLRRGSWILRLRLDLSQRFRGTAAMVTVNKVGAAPSVRLVKLNAKGNAKLSAKFNKGKISWVEVTLVNAGDDFTCRRNTRFSCAGRSKDDNRVQRLDARAVRR